MPPAGAECAWMGPPRRDTDLNHRQKLIIATKIQNPKPKTAQSQYDRSS
ncbi:MAG: hypothetical protein JGK17_14040 [Microcoleus sp. PH2017_10_PVI_O_A]|nr:MULTISPECIES: hypothetical protein [unclassified Microcoleus]MCC3406684.1 hypothetical protein [Microcoleus sp. PH2017_10_PVI_O_A]MCC3460680.1 hypothetical protein [Microcoleus sp. PH2017_11_PCY_U_A]MCC3479243.1 hypothetical protein [Microcoleus sp. PH2017_12_PCY_D_A]MCC3528182.1 hypothetical protein [Microcoleus sp. PH2017_21_RUC_O_A]MCC3540209.1 hypothetical protein [Microcoleus sp. PH2017_22_RUC_O_B]